MTLASTSTARLEPLSLPDAEIYYLPAIDLGPKADAILAQLIADTPWRQDEIFVWGRMHKQPRLVAWYGDRGSVYTYSGLRMMPLPWTPLLSDIRHRVESASSETFNSVLLNYYRGGRDSMGFHSDDEPELGPRPTIASLSLGQVRTFILKHRLDQTRDPVRLQLASGSLLIVKGETQHRWKHGVAKEPGRRGPRVNFTFRRIIPASAID